MSREPLLLVGAGGHARACVDVIEAEGRFVVAGFIDQSVPIGSKVLGYEVLGNDDTLPDLVRRFENVLIAVGYVSTPAPRVRLHTLVRDLGARMPVIVAPRAHVSRHATVGDGTIVLHGAVVNAGARIGRNCIVNTLALIEHDTEVGDDCHVATTAAVNSGVRIGDRSFIGSGAAVRQCLRIGADCFIGMGEVIVRDCPDGTRLTARARMR